MHLPFPLFVGLRYLRSRRRTRFISVVSAVALGGLALSVTALVVVLSVMNGFDRELHQRILALVPHVLVREQGKALADWEAVRRRLESQAGVRAAAPYIGGTVMLSTPGIVRGADLAGIRPAEDREVYRLDTSMTAGTLDALQPGRFGIVIGSLLARALGAGIGSQITVMLPEVSLTPAGAYPRMRRFEVVGIFSVGAQVDASAALIHLDDAARLYRTRGAAHALRLALDDADAAPEFAVRLRQQLPAPLVIEDWSATQGGLFSAVRMEKRMVTLLLLVVVAVAAFNIVSILTMVVAEKRGAIAVLRTMGASPGQISGIFTVQGLLIGIGGLLAGFAIGIPVALNAGRITAWLERVAGFHIFDPTVYFITAIPSQVQIGDLLVIAIAGLLLSLAATLVPARRAAAIGPAEVLRYE